MPRFMSRAPLIKSIIFLRDLKSAVARRKVKLMALVLNKLCNAANMPFRSRPKGLTGLLVLSVIIFHQVPACFPANIKLWDASITSKPVSQKHHRLNQRYPRIKVKQDQACCITITDQVTAVPLTFAVLPTALTLSG